MPKSSMESLRPCDLRALHLGADVVEVVDQHALGQFELDSCGIGAGAFEGAERLADEVRLAELARADVDGDAEVAGGIVFGPLGSLGESGFHDPGTEGNDEAGFLSERDEFDRGKRTAAGVVPAQQGFDAGDPVAIDLGLVDEPELIGPMARRRSSSMAARALTAAWREGAKKRTALRPAALA